MSPAPRKKKDEEAPTAAEVEAKASEEAGESVPKAEEETPRAGRQEEAGGEEAGRAEGRRRGEGRRRQGRGRRLRRGEAGAKKPAAKKKAAPKAEAKPAAKPARKRDQPRAKRAPDEPAVLVSAKARYVRTSARKARLVCDHIRGKDVEQARAILSFTPRGAAKPWLKLLESAIANAEHNHELVGDELKIASIHADEGPTLKRYRPRAMGRATRIRKRTSHLTITLTPKE